MRVWTHWTNGKKRTGERLGGDVETAQAIVVGLGKVSNCDLANITDLYGTSHCIMAEATVDAVVSVVAGGGRAVLLVDWMITDMVSVRRNVASLPRQSATSVLT